MAGGDQIAFDPNRNIFFEAGRFQAGGPVLGIIDGSTETNATNTSPVIGSTATEWSLNVLGRVATLARRWQFDSGRKRAG